MRNETMQDALSAGEIGTKYDQAAKMLWRNREILAPLLKYAIRELADLPVEDIIRLIDADSISEDTPVSDLPPTAIPQSTELGSATEKPITYDFRFKVKNPKLSTTDLLVVMHVDLEFQNSYRPVLKNGKSYPIIKRAIYYTARGISSQLGRITKKTNYSDLEKMISIWLVNEQIPLALQNTATRYYISKEDFIGDTDEPTDNYDLMEIIIIRRGENGDITKPIFDFLKGVFDADIQAIDRYTPVSDNPELVKEVTDMPGMSQTIYKNGYDSGYDNGYDACVLSLIKDGDISIDRAAQKLDKTTDEIQEMLNQWMASTENGTS